MLTARLVVICIFNNIEKRLNMWPRDTEIPRKGTNQTSKDEKMMSEKKITLDVVMGDEILQQMISEL